MHLSLFFLEITGNFILDNWAELSLAVSIYYFSTTWDELESKGNSHFFDFDCLPLEIDYAVDHPVVLSIQTKTKHLVNKYSLKSQKFLLEMLMHNRVQGR